MTKVRFDFKKNKFILLILAILFLIALFIDEAKYLWLTAIFHFGFAGVYSIVLISLIRKEKLIYSALKLFIGICIFWLLILLMFMLKNRVLNLPRRDFSVYVDYVSFGIVTITSIISLMSHAIKNSKSKNSNKKFFIISGLTSLATYLIPFFLTGMLRADLFILWAAYPIAYITFITSWVSSRKIITNILKWLAGVISSFILTILALVFFISIGSSLGHGAEFILGGILITITIGTAVITAITMTVRVKKLGNS